jgi:hypothetical protein
MAIDWYHLGRIRPMEEVSTRINALTAESINRYLEANPPTGFHVASLGAQPLEIPS